MFLADSPYLRCIVTRPAEPSRPRVRGQTRSHIREPARRAGASMGPPERPTGRTPHRTRYGMPADRVGADRHLAEGPDRKGA